MLPSKHLETGYIHRLLYYIDLRVMVMVMVLIASFNNISIISWRSVLSIEETGISGENHGPAASH